MIKKILLIIILIGAIFVFFNKDFFNKNRFLNPIPEKPIKTYDKELSILFIGNSYTFTNDLPGMILKIADSDPKNNIKFNIESFARGGASLKSLWGQDAVNLLRKKHWDYVILQNNSLWALYPEDIQDSFEVANSWREETEKSATNTILFVTWARKPNSHWYKDPETSFLQNADYVQGEINKYSQILARKLHSSLLMVGDVWMFMSQMHPEIDLYNADGSHPNVSGAYLNSLIFYHYFSTIKSLDSVSYAPDLIKKEDVNILKDAATIVDYKNIN